MFLANYSDGLTDAPLPEMIQQFKESGKIACFIAVHPPISFHLAEFDGKDPSNGYGRVRNRKSGSTAVTSSSERRFSISSQDGEELVLEPFNRLIDGGHLDGI